MTFSSITQYLARMLNLDTSTDPIRTELQRLSDEYQVDLISDLTIPDLLPEISSRIIERLNELESELIGDQLRIIAQRYIDRLSDSNLRVHQKFFRWLKNQDVDNILLLPRTFRRWLEIIERDDEYVVHADLPKYLSFESDEFRALEYRISGKLVDISENIHDRLESDLNEYLN